MTPRNSTAAVSPETSTVDGGSVGIGTSQADIPVEQPDSGSGACGADTVVAAETPDGPWACGASNIHT